MITINFLGGARKSFSTDKITIEQSNITIKELLDQLLKNKPKNTLDFDTKNLLVAVNGVDSSALDGYSTIIKSGDVISIIPVIHGGSGRIQFTIKNYLIELFPIRKTKSSIEFLDVVRKEFPSIAIQAIKYNFILNKNHAKKIIALSINAKKNNRLLSQKVETDILMRFSGTTQISQAIKIAGLDDNHNSIIIGIGTKSGLEKLNNYLKPNLIEFKQNNSSFLKKQFGISQKQISCVQSNAPLEDLLTEKAAILF